MNGTNVSHSFKGPLLFVFVQPFIAPYLFLFLLTGRSSVTQFCDFTLIAVLEPILSDGNKSYPYFLTLLYSESFYTFPPLSFFLDDIELS